MNIFYKFNRNALCLSHTLFVHQKFHLLFCRWFHDVVKIFETRKFIWNYNCYLFVIYYSFIHKFFPQFFGSHKILIPLLLSLLMCYNSSMNAIHFQHTFNTFIRMSRTTIKISTETLCSKPIGMQLWARANACVKWTVKRSFCFSNKFLFRMFRKWFHIYFVYLSLSLCVCVCVYL